MRNGQCAFEAFDSYRMNRESSLHKRPLTCTICSGLYLLIGMTSFSSKWILSHSTWYKFRRSRHWGDRQSRYGEFLLVAVGVTVSRLCRRACSNLIRLVNLPCVNVKHLP